MQILLISCVLFVVSFLAQMVIWRVRLPDQQIRALLVIFAITFGLWLVGAVVFSMLFLDVLQVALLYGSVSLCYVITYSAIEADSPTLSLIRFLATKRDQGCSGDEIERLLARHSFVGARLAALVHSGLIREQNGRYVIAGKQSLAFRVILGFRRVYGSIPKGG
jgi:hypothetical protein